MKLADVLDELVEEKGLDRAVLSDIIAEGMLSAYEKKYPDLALRAHYDEATGQVTVEIEKTVISSVQDEYAQISLKKARHINKKINIDDMLWIPFDGSIGRIEILRAKQVIANKIRTIEAKVVYDEFKEKEGDIVHGIIHKCERGGMVIKIEDTLAFLPRSLSSPDDKCVIGYSIRALLKDVLLEPRHDSQLILDRASQEFLHKLFELEIPEIYEKLVEIKAIVRAPGYKSKVAVISNDTNIDPVGTCVGVGGSRIKPILKELGNEKIDIIPWSESAELMVKNALKPAQINRVDIINEKTAHVWMDEDQRSLAIGKMGQNISLASRLTGCDIQIMQQDKQPAKDLEDIEID